MEFDRVDLDQGLPTPNGLAQSYVDRRYPPGDPRPHARHVLGIRLDARLAVHRGP